MSEPIVEIRDLSVTFPGESGPVRAVRNLNLDLRAGEVLGLVGESGSGKSVTSLSVIGLLPPTATVSGEVLFGGKNLLSLNDKDMSGHRGKDIAMIFQDPLSALNPVQTIGDQIAEAIDAADTELAIDLGDTLLILVQQHNAREEDMLYPEAEKLLIGEWDELSAALAEYEDFAV